MVEFDIDRFEFNSYDFMKHIIDHFNDGEKAKYDLYQYIRCIDELDFEEIAELVYKVNISPGNEETVRIHDIGPYEIKQHELSYEYIHELDLIIEKSLDKEITK